MFNYFVNKVTKTELWSAVSSYYDALPAQDSGLIHANSPWSGAYTISPTLWVVAHTTQFVSPGWRYLEGDGTGYSPGFGAHTTFLSTNQTDYSVVLDTFESTSPPLVTFHLTGGLSTGLVSIWRTSAYAPLTKVAQVRPVNGSFSYTFDPDCLYTITTTSGQGRGSTISPPAAPFPYSYNEDFEALEPGQTPRYFSDQSGTFETVSRADGAGTCLRQVVSAAGSEWVPEWIPYSIIGGGDWRDYDVAADIMLDDWFGVAFIMGRISSIPGFFNPVPVAYALALNAGNQRWELYVGETVIAWGPLRILPDEWHNLRLSMVGTTLDCYVDGQLMGSVTNSLSGFGMAGIGSGWNTAQYDNFSLRRHHGGELNLAPSARAVASSSWDNAPDFAPANINDGDLTSRWNAGPSDIKGSWIELDWPSPIAFNRLRLREFYTRITSHAIQHWSGKEWLNDEVGAKIGRDATIVFAPVVSDKVRVLINDSVTTPSFWEIQAFNDVVSNRTIVINEWMLNNTSAVVDPALNTYAPWFELYNPGTSAVNLAGYHLTGSWDHPLQFTIPAGYVIQPSGHLLVWSDGAEGSNRGGANDLHVNFTLDPTGVIGLLDPAGRFVDGVWLEPQATNKSFGSNPDGDPGISNLLSPTPREVNNQLSIPDPTGQGGRGGSRSIVLNSTSGQPQMHFVGMPFANHRIQGADSLSTTNWSTVGTAFADGFGRLDFTDTTATGNNQRFYRAVWP